MVNTGGGGVKGGICIQHQHLVPPLVHPWTSQVRLFTVALLNKGTSFFFQEGLEKDFLHAKVSTTLIFFFSIDGRRMKAKKELIWCCGNEGYHRA